jgi:hypothetical protein
MNRRGFLRGLTGIGALGLVGTVWAASVKG